MLRAEASTQRVTARTARDTWFDHLIIGLAFALLLSGFRSVIAGNDWWITTILVATLTGLACAILRAVGLRWVAPIAVVVELLALAWIFVPDTLIVILPTLDTFRELGSLASAAQVIIIEEQAPVAAAKPVVLVVASSFGLLVIVADVLLERRRAASGIGLLLLAVFATPALIAGDTPSVWLFVVVAALWLVILRSRTAVGGTLARRQRGPALVLGVAALAAAVTFPVISPDVSAVATSWGKPPPAVFGRGINPMLELGQNLRRNGTTTALTYTTGLPEAPYLKVATLRDFSGKTWKPGSTRQFSAPEGAEALMDPDIKVERESTTITIRQLRTTMLPVPYPMEDVSGLEGKWLRGFGLTMTSPDDDTRGQRYSVTSLDIQPTATQMRAIPPPSSRILVQHETDLPEKMPAIIEDTARRVTEDATNQYDQVIALQDYLRNDGAFAYSETAPVADGYDGNGIDVIAKFLEKKSGYCVHFSSAMAVMARTLGIPSRIAVGYAPGSVVGVRDGQNQYEATSDDLHAWTEIYFEGAGWISFEPTPGVGSATRFLEPGSPSSSTDDGEVSGTNRQSVREETNPVDSTAATSSDSSRTAPRTALITVAALVLLVGVPALLRWARRRWRFSRAGSSVEPLWRELEDSARDFGLPFSPTDTPRGFATRLGARDGIDHDALTRLLHRVERARFARTAIQEGDGSDDLRAILTSLSEGASRQERWRAIALPRSLAGRRAYAPSGPLQPVSTLG
ncbi:transglutaminase TgpA family protein [Aeromicrobium sp.]|uniref:transglutaminase TgpA family protein n=1 Tax=Aeromicrobium sp. TaxID=1871063 RepID=UPI002FC85C8D